MTAGSFVDRGREAVYAAEEAALAGTDLDVPCLLEELQARAAQLAAGDWWRSTGAPNVTVMGARVGTRSSSAGGDADGMTVRLAGPQSTLLTLTHELAHALAGPACGHDGSFRRAHLDVVAVMAGAGAASALADSYAALALAVSERRWAVPARGHGPGFTMVP